MAEINIDRERTALVVIDLQKGIVARETAPYGTSEVIGNARRLADAFRKNKMSVFLVHVAPTGPERLNTISDEQLSGKMQNMPKDWSEFVTELDIKE